MRCGTRYRDRTAANSASEAQDFVTGAAALAYGCLLKDMPVIVCTERRPSYCRSDCDRQQSSSAQIANTAGMRYRFQPVGWDFAGNFVTRCLAGNAIATRLAVVDQ